MHYLLAPKCSSTVVSKSSTIRRIKNVHRSCWSTGEFYGHNLSTTNIEMIARFFEKYPEYVDRTFLSVKVCMTSHVILSLADGPAPPGGRQSRRNGTRRVVSPSTTTDRSMPLSWVSRSESLSQSVNKINEKLRGTKRLDLFQSARVDPNVPVEVSIRALVNLKNEGKLDHIGMSECSAETLRKAHKVGYFSMPVPAAKCPVDPPDQCCGD